MRGLTAAGNGPEFSNRVSIIVDSCGDEGLDPQGSQGYSHKLTRKNSTVCDSLFALDNRVASPAETVAAGNTSSAVEPSHLDYYLDEFTSLSASIVKLPGHTANFSTASSNRPWPSIQCPLRLIAGGQPGI